MYEAYWELDRKPFEPGADVAAYYPSEAHQAAMLKLRYAIEGRTGVAVLAGSAGSGKSLLVRLLAERLPPEIGPLVHIVYPQMATAELLAYLATELDGEERSTAAVDESVGRIQRFLTKNMAKGLHAVVAIDEAHLLEGARTFEALRLLLNFESGGHPGLTFLLIGQPVLLPMLERLPLSSTLGS